ncbi:hypothetical protein ZONE111905_12595 [Zobellia nedashkovskayae]
MPFEPLIIKKVQTEIKKTAFSCSANTNEQINSERLD